jgi:energy-coupling factor transport system substrate-specific component
LAIAMLDLVSMWKNPKMLALTALTALLYAGSMFPFKDLTLFGGYVDFGRFGIGIPVAFSFLFGPAAAWGAAFGNLIYDASVGGLNYGSIGGFVGNFLIGYLPYKLYSILSKEKADLKNLKTLGLFAAVSALACVVCGLVIGFELYLLYGLPLAYIISMIAITDGLWAIILGSILLASTYGLVSKHKLLYTDIMQGEPEKT